MKHTFVIPFNFAQACGKLERKDCNNVSKAIFGKFCFKTVEMLSRIGIIAICLFPLWPPMMRKGVHYLSIGAAGFLMLIFGLGLLKYAVFGLLFVLSGGKLRFWLFPNLTEDVGFLESFMPVYDYTYTGKA